MLRRALTNVKARQKGAQTGHVLLKRKSDALSVRFRGILSRIRRLKSPDEKGGVVETLRASHFSFLQMSMAVGSDAAKWLITEAAASARPSSGALSPMSVVGSAGSSCTATFQVSARMENVAGVQLPVFDVFHQRETHLPASPGSTASGLRTGNSSMLALVKGGIQVHRCREAFRRALAVLVDLASAQTSFMMLDRIIKATNRRVNALEFVLLPRLEDTAAYITSELDEADREDFYRLKKIQSNKNKSE